MVKLLQLLSFPLFRLITSLLTKRKAIDLHYKHVQTNKTYVLASNHTGMPDPFIICYSIPILLSFKLTPYRFFITNRFFKGALGFYLRAMGGFPSHEHPKLRFGLEVAGEALSKHQTVVIFPEGRIMKSSIQEVEPKRGVSVLAKEKDIMIIPARVHWNREKGIFKSYSLAVGKPFDGSKMSPQEIMDVVYSLKFE